LKRASMRFWLCGSAILPCSALLVSMPSFLSGQLQNSAKRANEFTLAGLRPGRDKVSKAIRLYKKPLTGKPGDSSFGWDDVCIVQSLFLDVENSGRIETIRTASHDKWTTADCSPERPVWKTGQGLAVRDSCLRVSQLYGNPNSRSPSTKNGQPLELLYYAFDWAGPDVPQVMEVVCTAPKDGISGRVVEITLAAGSL